MNLYVWFGHVCAEQFVLCAVAESEEEARTVASEQVRGKVVYHADEFVDALSGAPNHVLPAPCAAWEWVI